MGNRVLEARFRRVQNRWECRLYPDGKEQVGLDWFEWVLPTANRLERELLGSLFEGDVAQALLGQCWDLRLRPELFGTKSNGIPEAPWNTLIHPVDRLHVFDVGWTVTELVVLPEARETTGIVSVIGSPSLAKTLRQSLGPVVEETTVDKLPGKSIVVMALGASDAEAAALESKAWKQACPFIVWCASEPPSPQVPCVFRADTLKEKFENWLSRFLAPVLRGVDPVQAFAEATSSVDARTALAIRGAFQNWKVAESGLKLPPHWYILLDRSKQQADLKLLTEGLVSEQNRRRIQVALTPGPQGAGLDLFRQRPLQDTGKYKVVEWDAGWADEPGSTLQVLMSRVRADSAQALPYRLEELAAKYPEGRALFLVRHQTISGEVHDDATSVRIAELQRYLDSLERLSQSLATKSFRMLFHISVLGAQTADLASLKKKTDHYMSSPLKTLDAGVPDEELRDWLDAHEVPYTDDDIKVWVGHTYDDLVQAIVQRNPGLLRP